MRLSLFTSNWRIITNDPWVINCIKECTLDLTEDPVQCLLPLEMSFSKEETDNITTEVKQMLGKQAISQVPREQEAKGFHSQLFTIPQAHQRETGHPIMLHLRTDNTTAISYINKYRGTVSPTLNSKDLWL